MNIGCMEEEQETYVGGVWNIAHVEAEVVDAGWKVREGPRTMASNKEGHQGGADHQRGAVKSTFRPEGAGEITVDSAAEESVCPKIWRMACPSREPARRLKFMNASDESINHYGEKEANFTIGGRGRWRP